MAMSDEERREINRLFEGGELIPSEILVMVRKRLFKAKRRYHLDHETFKDLVQTCLLKIWKLENEFTNKPLVYFGGVVQHAVMDCCRERAKMSFSDVESEEFFSINEIGMMNDVLTLMYSKCYVDRLIHTVLDDEETAIFKLRLYEGLTFERISALLELSLATVKRRNSDAVEKLRSRLRQIARKA